MYLLWLIDTAQDLDRGGGAYGEQDWHNRKQCSRKLRINRYFIVTLLALSNLKVHNVEQY